jgi:multiple sugar transport system permease protein
MQTRSFPSERVLRVRRTRQKQRRALAVPHVFIRRLGRGLVALSVYLAALITLFPFAWLLLTSLKAPGDVFRRPPAWVFAPTLENYQRVLFDADINLGGAFVSTVVITLVSTGLSVTIGTLAAYSLARLPLPGKSAYSLLVLWTRMLPPIALVIPLYLVLLHADLLDTRTGLIVVYTAFNTPFVIWIMRSFFADIPAELEDAALIDGCSRFGTFMRVALPLSAPGLATASVLSAFWVWNDFLFAFMYARNETVTLMVLASRFQEEEGVKWGLLAATTTLAILPVLLFTLLIQRHIVQGMISGSVKG